MCCPPDLPPVQFFGTRSLGDLSPADKLWLYKAIKSLHNGFKNAMMVDASRNSSARSRVRARSGSRPCSS